MTLVSDARRIARAGIRAADPARAVRANFGRTSRKGSFRVGDRRLRVPSGGDLHLVAIGKAAGAMIDAARSVAGPHTPGFAVTPFGYPEPRSGIGAVFGDHPVPGRRSFRAGARLLEYVRSLEGDDAVLYLISGGGSAVAEVPAAALSPGSVALTTRELLASGAPIGAINAIRRHLSAIKGGRLARTARSRRFATIAISDVEGDRPEDIASGPTVGDPTTYWDALDAARRWGLEGMLPSVVGRHLEAGLRGERPETPRPSDPFLRRAPFVIAARNRTSVAASAAEARRRGYAPRILARSIVGDTDLAGRRFARTLLASRGPRARALIGGGETTVLLGPRPGRGGRNQEFALVAAPLIEGEDLLILSLGTDGIDGPTDAAGAWVDGRSAERARRLGLDLEAARRRHASYPALDRLGSLVRTGPTGTNVRDLHVGLAAARRYGRYGRK